MEGFTDEEKRKLLKFVTSCSRPPLLGFKVLLCAFALKPLVTEKGSGIPRGGVGVRGRSSSGGRVPTVTDFVTRPYSTLHICRIFVRMGRGHRNHSYQLLALATLVLASLCFWPGLSEGE